MNNSNNSTTNNSATNIITNTATTLTTVNNEKYLVSALYMFLSVVGLSLEIFVLFIVFKLNGFRLSSFNAFLVSVMWTEICSFALYLFYASPCILTETQIFGKLGGEILGNFETVDFLALVFTTFFISLNRAMSLSGSLAYEKIFTENLTVFYCVISWILAAIAVGIDISLKCKTAFLEHSFYFSEECLGQPPALTATSLTIYVGVYCVALVYGYAIRKLFSQHRQMKSNNQQLQANMSKKKRLLFYQALCIWGTLFINVISFRIIPAFLEGLAAVLLTAFIVLGKSFVSPVCMLIFSRDIRRAAINIIFTRPLNSNGVSLGMRIMKIGPAKEN